MAFVTTSTIALERSTRVACAMALVRSTNVAVPTFLPETVTAMATSSMRLANAVAL